MLATKVPKFFTRTKVGRGNFHNFENEKNENLAKRLKSRICLNDEIVISGISARLPLSENLEEFKQNLFSKVDMVTPTQRWTPGLYNLPSRTGQIRNLDKFDAGFFGIHSKLAHVMDPQMRKVLEVAYEAILDAGVNPTSLRGSNTAVYSGVNSLESSEYLFYGAPEDICAFNIFGNPSFFLVNRISYHLDLHGPSVAVNTACSSGLHALADAVECLKRGECDAALATGTQIGLLPRTFKDLHNTQALSPDGSCKAFDESANGFVRSDGVVAVFLQRKSQAKRNYATIKGVGTNFDGYTKDGISVPSWEWQASLARRVLRENDIDPQSIKYIEAHGTGTPIGDPLELKGLQETYCRNSLIQTQRDSPLLVGSVKSNMGHAEFASGLVSLSKCIISIQEKQIPGNLHFHNPNPNIPQLRDGTIKIVDQHTTFSSGLMAINNFGMGGTNAHLIIEPNWTPSSSETKLSRSHHLNPQAPSAPFLVPFSGRTKEAVEEPLRKLQIQSGDGLTLADTNQVALLQNIFKENIPGHFFRGFSILNPISSNRQLEESSKLADVEVVEQGGGDSKRPLWFVFPGMGAQWQGMGKDLIESFPVFEESIARSAAVLKDSFGQSLYELLDPKCTSIFTNVRDAFLVNSVAQMALFDTLTAIGLTADGFVGHSHGETLVSYADGCLTLDQVIKLSYHKGTAFLNLKCAGIAAMAAVDLSWSDALEKCPRGVIQPVCNNSATNVTVAGLDKDIGPFIQQMKDQGIRATKVNSCGQPAHCFLIEEMKEPLLNSLKQLIPNPKKMSTKWLSTAVVPLIEKSDMTSTMKLPTDRLCSAEYHLFNTLNPVHFHEAVLQIPKNSLIVEVGAQAVFSGILKQTIGAECSVVAPMTRRLNENKVTHFLRSLGTMYNLGVDIDASKLYPSVKFPVAAETKMIAPLIKWDHRDSYIVSDFEELLSGKPLKISTEDSAHSFLLGHKVDGRVIYPGMGYLVDIWKHFANISASPNFETFPIVFENVEFKRAVFIPDQSQVTIFLRAFSGSGWFQVAQGSDVVVSGQVRPCEEFEKEILNFENEIQVKEDKTQILESSEIYKILRLRGYEYDGDFKGITSLDIEGNWAQLKWVGNWTSFMDSILQTKSTRILTNQTFVPRRIQKITINPIVFQQSLNSNLDQNQIEKYQQQDSKTLQVDLKMFKNVDTFQCPGIEIRGFEATEIQRRRSTVTPTVETYEFLPYFNKSSTHFPMSTSKYLHQIAGIINDNVESRDKLKIVQVLTPNDSVNSVLSPFFKSNKFVLLTPKNFPIFENDQSKNFENVKTVQIDFDDKAQSVDAITHNFKDANLIVLDNQDLDYISIAYQNLNENSFLLIKNDENLNSETRIKYPENFSLISQIGNENEQFLLLRKKIPNLMQNYEILSVDTPNFNWVPNLQEKLSNLQVKSSEGENNQRIYLVSQSHQSGILGFGKSIHLEPKGNLIRVIYDPEKTMTFDTHNNGFPSKDLEEIVEKDLRLNICQNSQLGSYFHCPIDYQINTDSKSKDLPIINNNFKPSQILTNLSPTRFAYLNMKMAGDLSSLHWQSSPLALQPFESLIKVKYSSINFRDLMLATGQLPLDISSAASASKGLKSDSSFLGSEFSGYDSSGLRVMGMTPSQAMATFVDSKNSICWPIPDHWTVAEAATIPIVYVTVLYAFERGNVQPGESILIHSGAGGVGQAAINLALSKNCQVYTTVGSEAKKNYLLKLFPQLNPSHIGNSRDSSFEPMIRHLTGGRGVDIVLNSLAGDLLQTSLRCLGSNGRFLEIGKQDAVLNSNVGLSWILKNISVMGIDFNFQEIIESEKEKLKFIKILQDAIDLGVVKPLSTTKFGFEESEQAFRFMASGKHIGKILIDMEKNLRGQDQHTKDAVEIPNSSITQVKEVDAVAKTFFHPEKSFVVVGGLGGFGLEMASWLIERGARKLVLASRSGVTKGYQEFYIKSWQRQGIQIETPICDLTNFNEAQKLISKVESNLGPLGGFFNCGMVLRDGLFENQTIENFQQVSAAKIKITQNFDTLIRNKNMDLDHFVCISSAAAGRGNAGQTNYSYANAAMEQICQLRKRDGLSALAIQFGMIDDVGVVVEKMAGRAILLGQFKNTLPQRVSSCLDILDFGLSRSSKLTSAVISSLVYSQEKSDFAQGTKKKLTEKVSNILGLRDAIKINSSSTLAELGLDSLLTAEVKQTLEGEFGLVLSNPDIRRLTFRNLEQIQEGSFESSGSKKTQDKENLTRTSFLSTKKLVHLNPDADLKGVHNILFLVHGAEGHTDTLRKLASKLSCSVYGLELVHDEKGVLNTVTDIAMDYIDELRKIQPKGPYNLGGYSSGGAIAHEMATILEQQHEKVEFLFFLDGICITPVETSSASTETERENHTNMYRLLLQDLTGKTEDRQVLRQIMSGELEQDIKSMAKNLQDKFPLESLSNLTSFIKTIFQRVTIIRGHVPQKQGQDGFRGQAVLFKADISSHFPSFLITHDHNLNKFCASPVQIHKVRGDHVSFLQDPHVVQIAEIMNHILKNS